jgi:chorismate mutase
MGTEVANAHVKLALEYDIDVLWIGGTTVNPAVQEIADALAGIKHFCKKSCKPRFMSLWLGGVERLYNAGIEKLE